MTGLKVKGLMGEDISVFPGKMVYSPERWCIPRTALRRNIFLYRFCILSIHCYIPRKCWAYTVPTLFHTKNCPGNTPTWAFLSSPMTTYDACCLQSHCSNSKNILFFFVKTKKVYNFPWATTMLCFQDGETERKRAALDPTPNIYVFFVQNQYNSLSNPNSVRGIHHLSGE